MFSKTGSFLLKTLHIEISIVKICELVELTDLEEFQWKFWSGEFCVDVGVQQGSVIRPLLFLIFMEAWSREFCTHCIWERLCTDNSTTISKVLICENLNWLEELWRWVYPNQSFDQRSIAEDWILWMSVAFSCMLFLKGSGVNLIYCDSFQHWDHKY